MPTHRSFFRLKGRRGEYYLVERGTNGNQKHVIIIADINELAAPIEGLLNLAVLSSLGVDGWV